MSEMDEKPQHTELPEEHLAQQSAAFEASRSDRDRTLSAVHRLEEALETAAPGREKQWLRHVLDALSALESAIANERQESLRPDSLLSMIGRDFPRRFGSRVRQLREQHDDITQQVVSMRGQVREMRGETTDVTDLRQRLGWLVRAIHHRRARETDLVFEALSLDLGRPRERAVEH
jgi:hypothetical protein